MIGIDGAPVLNYVGNFFGKAANNTAPTWDFSTVNQTITGKYFVEDNKAYRGGIRLGFGSEKTINTVADRATTAAPVFPSAPNANVENIMKAGNTNIGLSAGIEWRKGTTRLQGFYGAELGIGINSSKRTYEYGNALNQNVTGNVDVDIADDFGTGNIDNDPYGNIGRVLSDKSGLGFSVGVRGFIGAEYFVLPKLSVGGEFGWGLAFVANGTSKVELESEGLVGGAEQAATFTTESKNGSRIAVDTDNINKLFGPAGRLNITFHF